MDNYGANTQTTHKKVMCDGPQAVIPWTLRTRSQVTKTNSNPIPFSGTSRKTLHGVGNRELITSLIHLTALKITVLSVCIVFLIIYNLLTNQIENKNILSYNLYPKTETRAIVYKLKSKRCM